MDVLDSQSYVNSTAFEFLLLELVLSSVRTSHQLKEQREGSQLQPKESLDIITTTEPLSTIPGDFPGTVNLLDSSELHEDDATLRIENCGYLVGLKLADLLLYKIGSGNQKLVDILDVMKFLCRDVWKALYNKQMDNLRTNNRGTFVLVDNRYKFIANLASQNGSADTVNKAMAHLWFPCGVIRGILMSFGTECRVVAEIGDFPLVTFNIHTGINN